MKPSYEELEEQLNRSRRLCDAALASERVWETTMMEACGEDGPKSVADKFAELEARCAALSAKFSMINGLMDAAEQANKLAQEATEKLVQERDALAAENAGLIRSSEILLHEASEVYRSYNKTQLPDGNLVDEQSLQEVYDAINATPATDAFLAEVRAQGVEMLNTQFKKCTGMLYADSVVSTAEHFAAQLRNGGAQ